MTKQTGETKCFEPDEEPSLSDLTDAQYLTHLAGRLMHIPVSHGTDGYDIDRLVEIAHKFEPTFGMVSVDKQALLDVVRKLDFGASVKDFPSAFDKLRLAFTRDEVATGVIK